jgi:hypothetical protein
VPIATSPGTSGSTAPAASVSISSSPCQEPGSEAARGREAGAGSLGARGSSGRDDEERPVVRIGAVGLEAFFNDHEQVFFHRGHPAPAC